LSGLSARADSCDCCGLRSKAAGVRSDEVVDVDDRDLVEEGRIHGLVEAHRERAPLTYPDAGVAAVPLGAHGRARNVLGLHVGVRRGAHHLDALPLEVVDKNNGTTLRAVRACPGC
jgi:hypothetical protein